MINTTWKKWWKQQLRQSHHTSLIARRKCLESKLCALAKEIAVKGNILIYIWLMESLLSSGSDWCHFTWSDCRKVLHKNIGAWEKDKNILFTILTFYILKKAVWVMLMILLDHFTCQKRSHYTSTTSESNSGLLNQQSDQNWSSLFSTSMFS